MSGDKETASPAVNDEVKPGASQATDTGTSTVGSEDRSSQTQPQGDAVAKEPSELEKLREKLTGIPAAEPPAQAEPAAQDAPADDTAAPQTPQADATPSDEPADEHDETRLSDEEYGKLSERTRRRIAGLSRQVKDLTAKLEKMPDEAVIGNGQYIADYMHELRLTPQQMHDSLQLLKGYLSCDPKALPGLTEAVQRLARLSGQPDPTQASAAIAPLTGRLPARYQELIEVNNFTEDEARMCAAVLSGGGQSRREPAASAQPRATPPAPMQSGIPEPDANRVRARDEAQDRDDHDEEAQKRINAAAGKLIVQFLTKQGVKGDVQQHVEKNLWPYLIEAAPGGDPTQIPPKRRLDAVEVAHQRWQLDQASAAKARPTRQGSITGGTNGGAPAPTQPRTAKPVTPMQQLRAKLVGP
jgi:hypothetical protein